MVTTTHDSKRKSIQIYLLAAPEDKMVCEDIVKHLKPITMNSPRPIEVSSDFNIPAGADTEKYKQRVFDADIVLALISADFIDNDDIYSRNQKVIARQNNQETILIPILVRNFMWRATPFGSMGVVLPKNYQPLNNKQFWNSPDDAVMAVVSEIYDSINALPQQKIEEVQAPPPVQEAPVKPSPIQAEPPAPAKELVQAQTEIVQTALPSQEAPVKPASSKVETPPLAKEPVQAQAKAVQPAPALHAEKVSAPPAPKVSSTPSTGQTMASLPIADDWRRKYYRTVLLKRGAAILLDQIII
ncbi:MAG TPA: hypothetical protein VJ987_09135, partial [Anaerolineales bacterium]|nr:hypothetical protein [Anaerolineales bacterium]